MRCDAERSDLQYRAKWCSPCCGTDPGGAAAWSNELLRAKRGVLRAATPRVVVCDAMRGDAECGQRVRSQPAHVDCVRSVCQELSSDSSAEWLKVATLELYVL